ncbi:hypothetical protein EXS66_01930 [Candidatus Saccharibacteria bacterium]|nr:hypothetical protein [Candidatus Saccharibacteria bacterium]
MEDKNSDTDKKDNKTEEESVDDDAKLTKAPKVKKKLYKKPWFWVTAVLSVLAIGLAIFFGIYFSAQNKNKQTISSSWHDIIQQANALDELSKKITDTASFEAYNTSLQALNSSLNDKKFNAQKLKYRAQDVQDYTEYLDAYGSYVSESSKYADKIIDFTEQQSDKLKDLASIARTSADKLKNAAKYLTESMPNSAFEIQNALLEASQTISANELSVKSKEQAEQAQTAKDIADKQATEATAGNYLNAFLAGNAPLIRQYMTQGYQEEFDFNQLTESAREVVYPASFRILTNQKIEASKYKVQANLVYKMRDGSGQYMTGNELIIIYNSSSAKWLVDGVGYGSSY